MRPILAAGASNGREICSRPPAARAAAAGLGARACAAAVRYFRNMASKIKRNTASADSTAEIGFRIIRYFAAPRQAAIEAYNHHAPSYDIIQHGYFISAGARRREM